MKILMPSEINRKFVESICRDSLTARVHSTRRSCTIATEKEKNWRLMYRVRTVASAYCEKIVDIPKSGLTPEIIKAAADSAVQALVDENPTITSVIAEEDKTPMTPNIP